jgi:hypothetical protein
MLVIRVITIKKGGGILKSVFAIAESALACQKCYFSIGTSSFNKTYAKLHFAPKPLAAVSFVCKKPSFAVASSSNFF